MLMPKTGNRQVSLSLNAALWARCIALKRRYGLNWSQIVGEFLLGLVGLLEEMERAAEPEQSAEKAISGFLMKFQEVYTSGVSDMYAVRDQLRSQAVETRSEPEQ
jgi:hypothetical protein